ncbi:MAG: alpha/beta hydrolase [Chloroflexota bacterium]
MNPELWLKSGEWLSIGGHRLFVRSVGRGMPVLALHAFPTSSYDYSRLVPLLSNHYHLILFDYPGYGFSDKSPVHPYSLFECADLVSAVAAHFGIQRAYLLAHDIGSSIALIGLLRQSLSIKKLILMNGSVVSIQFEDLTMRLIQRTLLHPTLGPWIGKLGLINRAFFASTTKKLFSYPLSRQELDDFWSIITYNNGSQLYPVLMRYMLERWQYQYQWLDALKEYPVPLTLIWGQADPIARPAVADIVMSYLPEAIYIRLAGVGHYPHWETPELVAEVVKHVFG